MTKKAVIRIGKAVLVCVLLIGCQKEEKQLHPVDDSGRYRHGTFQDDDDRRTDEIYQEDTVALSFEDSVVAAAADEAVRRVEEARKEMEQILEGRRAGSHSSAVQDDNRTVSHSSSDDDDNGPESGLYGFDPWDDEDDEWNMDREMTDLYPDEW